MKEWNPEMKYFQPLGEIETSRWVGAKADRLSMILGHTKIDLCHISPGYVFLPGSAEKSDVEKLHQKIIGTDTFVLRSSNLAEDQQNKSHAGHYQSFVLTGFQQIEERMPQCPKDGALLVQRYIETKKAGIAFSNAPGLPDGIGVISSALGQCSGVTAGISSIEDRIVHLSTGKTLQHVETHPRIFVRWDKERNQEIPSPVVAAKCDPFVLDDAQVRQVTDLVQSLKKYFSFSVDIEWGFDEFGQLWLFQVRPSPHIEKQWVSDRLSPRARRRFQASHVGWSIPNRWIVSSSELPTFARNSLRKDRTYSATLFGKDDGMPIEQALETIESAKNENLWFVEEFLTIAEGGLCEAIDDKVMVEWADTTLGEMTRGLTTPERYVVDVRNHRIEGKPSDAQKAEQLFRISELAVKTRASLGRGPIEWGREGKKLYFLDMTTTYRRGSLDDRVIFYGQAEGTVRQVSLKKSFHDLDVQSVHVYSKPKKENERKKSHIYVAQRPSMELFDRLSSAAGFIFREGPLLAHLCVLIMELKIPAIISPQMAIRLKNGENVLLDGARIQRIEVSCE